MPYLHTQTAVSCMRIKAYLCFLSSSTLFTHQDSSFLHENQGIFMFLVQQYLIYTQTAVSCMRIKAYSCFLSSSALLTHPDSSFLHENQGIFMFLVQQCLINSPRQQFLARESRHIHVYCPAVPYLHTQTAVSCTRIKAYSCFLSSSALFTRPNSSFLQKNQGIFMFLVQQCLIYSPRQ